MIDTTVQDVPVYEVHEVALALVFVLIIYFFAWFSGRIIKFFVKKVSGIHADLRNGIFVLITLIQFTIFILATGLLLINFNVRPEFIIGSLAILVTAIGVAFTGVAANFIGGVYILTTRPFKVGDFIKTQGIEGIVEEIGINYSSIITIDRTIVKIPNGNLMNTSLLNYMEKSEESANKIVPSGLFGPSKHFVIYKKMIELKLDIIDPPIPMKSVRNRLNKVFDEYTDVFGAKPLYYLGKHDFRQELFLLIRANDAYTLFNAWPYFMESLMTNIYQELQQEQSL